MILLIFEIDFRAHGHLDIVLFTFQFKRREWPMRRPGGWDPPNWGLAGPPPAFVDPLRPPEPPIFVVPTVAPSRAPPVPPNVEPPPIVPVAPLPPKAAGFKAPPPPLPTASPPQEFRPPPVPQTEYRSSDFPDRLQ